MKLVCLILLLYPACIFANTTSQPAKATIIDTVIPATPTKRIAPKYPVSAARNGQEGWVKMSFVINQQGEVIDPIVEDSNGIKSFERAARKAIKKWKYEPATRDGEKIEQCQMSVQMDFKMSLEPTVRRKFLTQYKVVSAALDSQDYSKANTELDKLHNQNTTNMAESAWLWMLDGSYANAIGDKKREQASVSRALSGNKAALGDGNLINLLSRLFVMQMQNNLFADALTTFAQLVEIESSHDVVKQIRPYVAKIEQALASDSHVIISGSIDENGSWHHTLGRSRFAVADIQGDLDEMEIRCANKRTRSTVASQTEWIIPAAWGQCTVFVKGSASSQFQLVELPTSI